MEVQSWLLDHSGSPLFIYWWRFGLFLFFTIVSNVSMNIDVNEQRPVQVPAFISFGYIPRSFPRWLYHFIFPLAMLECSNFSTSSPTCVISHFLFLFLLFYRCKCYLIVVHASAHLVIHTAIFPYCFICSSILSLFSQNRSIFWVKPHENSDIQLSLMYKNSHFIWFHLIQFQQHDEISGTGAQVTEGIKWER